MEAIDLNGQPLDLDLTLGCGQAFRWRKRADGVWLGVVTDRLLEISAEGDRLYWRAYPECGPEMIRDYFRLSDDVASIYTFLSASDPHLAELVERFHGLRLLRQDPSEALFSFVCSTVNNIPRIMVAIEELAMLYGNLVCEQGNLCYYTFPEADRLAGLPPGDLECLSVLGFRGRAIRAVAEQILVRGENWLPGLRNAPYEVAREDLRLLHGVGPKIADCVCLFALDKDQSVPVDTHIRQIAHRFFLPELKARSLTEGVYRAIQDVFARRYGRYAGWAQQFLFQEDILRPSGA